MSKRATVAEPATDTGWIDVPTPDRFGGVVFDSPILKLVQASLGPFLQHTNPCAGGSECNCGLQAAIVDLERREMLVRRYGLDD